MPLETNPLKSSVTARQADEIISLIKAGWGYNVTEVERLPLGSANCYIIDGDIRGFFKEFKSGFDISAVRREAELVDCISRRGIPCASFFRTLTGDAALCHRGRVLSLSRYIDGETIDYTNPLPEKYRQPEIQIEVAQMLGRIHHALSGFNLLYEMSGGWIHNYSPESLSAQYDELLRLNEQKSETMNESEPNRHAVFADRIAADLEYKKSLAARFIKLLTQNIMCDDAITSLFNVTYTPTHGDYHIGQLIFAGGRIKAVVDFSSAATLPAVWELMRSYVQSFREEYFDTDADSSDRIDIDSLCRYASAYLERFRLTSLDLAAAPYIYLFQLLRSKYGYSHYLRGDDPTAKLLNFAFRRTEICRELERNAGAISESLQKLL